jgi:hypothetical protein
VTLRLAHITIKKARGYGLINTILAIKGGAFSCKNISRFIMDS